MPSILVNTDLDLNSASRILNLLDPTAAQHPATKAYVDAQVEGINWKASARVATSSNINLSAPGAALDGVTLANGDRVLVRGQTSVPANGLYLFNGAASLMSRTADASTARELEMATVTVEEGTDAGTTWRQETVNFTLGSGNVTFTAFGTVVPAASESTAGKIEIADQTETDTGTDDARAITPLKLAAWSGRIKRYASSFGDGSATSYAKTHNLGSTDPLAQVWETAGDKRQVICDPQITDSNTITVLVVAAPTTNAYRLVVHV